MTRSSSSVSTFSAGPAPATRRQTPPPEVLVLMLGDLKSCVQNLAGIEAIRQGHKKARLTALVTAPYSALVKACPHLDHVEVVEVPKTLRETYRFVKPLRAETFSWVYDLTHSDFTRGLRRWFLPFAPRWSGISPGCSHPLPVTNTGRHPLDRQAHQLWLAGLGPENAYAENTAPATDLSWIFDARPGAPSMTPAFFGLSDDYVLLAPGDVPAAACWPLEKYRTLVEAVLAEDLMVAVLGGQGENVLARQIAGLDPRVRDLSGRTDVLQVTALAAQARFALGHANDVMHLVAASGVPTCVLYGGTADPDLSAPRGQLVTCLHAKTVPDIDPQAVWQAMRASGVFDAPLQALA